MSYLPSTTRLLKYFAVGAGAAGLALVVYGQMMDISGPTGQPGTHQEASAQQKAIQQQAPSETKASAERNAQGNNTASDWTVGELRPNGLRIKPSGRSDASAVLNPEQFDRAEVRRAYRIATEIPEVLNRLYCWCGCENRGVHRSNLGCFEDKMAVNCAVCRGTAEIASRMTKNGTTDAGKIQAAVDQEWGPDQ